jgi:hypothetical protein
VVKPFTPNEALNSHSHQIPDAVIEVVNGLLSQRVGSGRHIYIHQKEVIDALLMRGFVREEIFAKNMLDFEGVFRASGWVVTYDKPAYNESYDAFWIFFAA